MPAVSEKQRRFFGAVMGAKKGKPGASGAAKETASSMSEEQIKHYLHKKGSAMNEVYAQGFIDKCAAMGVSHELLVKQAVNWGAMGEGAMNLGRQAMTKIKPVASRARELITGSAASKLESMGQGASGALAENVAAELPAEKLKVLLARLGLGVGSVVAGGHAIARAPDLGTYGGIAGIVSERRRQAKQHPLATKIKSLAGR